MKVNHRMLISVLLALFCGMAQATQFNAVTTTDAFADVMANVKDAIIGRGLNISHVLHASDMLNRTGPDLGYPENIFKQAESIEFCSASLSHQLVAINPNNMVVCPFTIGVYQLEADTDKVYVTYRLPQAGEESAKVIDKVEQLIQSIVLEATE